jgi:hypothetical protein
MKSRRRIAFLKAWDHANPSMITAGICDRRNGVQRIKLHTSNSEQPMSALDQKRTFRDVRAMSALPPKADVAHRFVPKAK